MRLLISVVAALAAGCLASAAEAKSLVYCSEAAPEGFDPALYVTAATFDASSRTLYDRLVEFDSKTGQIVPGLAESWDVSADGRSYTFHLRQGVKFQTTAYFTPTRDLDADDVVFSLDRQSNKKNPYYSYAGGTWPYYGATAMDALVKSVAKVDAQTVKVTLNRPDSGLLYDLAMDFASVPSKEYADTLIKPDKRTQLDQQPVGTGPYQFVAYQPGVNVTYKANPDYWAGVQKIDDLTFRIVPAPADRLALLKSGDCQVVADLDPASLKTASTDPALAVASTERFDLAYLAVNTSQKPFDDPRVRKALGLAVDKGAIVAGVYSGAADPADTIMPHTMWGYDGTIPADAASIAAARQLLADAGVTGLKLKLLTATDGRPYDPDLVATATTIAANLAGIGVEATVVTADSLADYFRRASAKDRDSAVVIGWTGDNGDPVGFLSLLLSCDAVGTSNRAQWCDKSFNGLLDQARAATDPDAEKKSLSDAQNALATAVPIIPIAHTLVEVPMSKKVTGYVVDPLGHHSFVGVDVAN